MENTHIDRIYAIKLLAFSIIVSGIIFVYIFSLSLACNVHLLECTVGSEILSFSLVINIIFVIFFISLAIYKPPLTKKHLDFIVAVYFVLVTATAFFFISFQKGSILFSVIGTENECELVSFLEHKYSEYGSDCYKDLAIIRNDISYCKNTKFSLSSLSPYALCNQYFAEKSGDTSLCSQDNRTCIINVASRMKDPTLCEQIMNDSYERFKCLAASSGIEKYTATSLTFESIPLEKILVDRGEKNVELARIKITAIGGDAGLISISFNDDSENDVVKERITNIRLYDGSKLLPYYVTSRPLDISYSKSEYNAQFGSEGFFVLKDKPVILSVKGDILNESGTVNFKGRVIGSYSNFSVIYSKGTGTSSQINIK